MNIIKNPEPGGLRLATLWESGPNNIVQCNLCAHRCRIRPGKLGICGVRLNQSGQLFTRVYGMATSLAVDPIEKKPLFHFHPGASALSLATVGCNFGCLHCQNYSISQWSKGKPVDSPVPGSFVDPSEVVESASANQCEVIAYTYTEPTVFFEYALDIARLAANRGIKNIFVTNGYLTPEAVELIAPYLHGANVDLKGMDDRMLQREVKAQSGPVLRTIEDLWRRGIWVEVTTLIIPGSNDDEEQLNQIAQFIAHLSPDIPWHVSRFHPMYQRFDRPPTPLSTLRRAFEIGQAQGLRYVYTGNVWGDEGESTHCPNCGQVVIARRGFSITRVSLKQGHCVFCGAQIPGQGMP